MRFAVCLTLASLLLASADLTAQRRGRFRREGPPPTRPTQQEPAQPDKATEKPKSHTAIVGGDVYLGTGQRITGATVLIGDDKILAVGHDVELPEGTKILDAKGKTVSPGFVCIAGSGMGAGRSEPFIDGCNPFDPQIKQALAAGITSFLAGSARGGSTPSGSTAVIKLAYGDLESMVLEEGAVLSMSAQLSLADRHKFLELVDKAKEHQEALEKFSADKAKDPKKEAPKAPAGTDKILEVLSGEKRLWIQLGSSGFNPFGGMRLGRATSSDRNAISAALEIAEKLGTPVVLDKPISAWLCADEIAATGSMVIVSPRSVTPTDPKDPDLSGSNLATAAILSRAGVPVAVTCPQGMFGGAGVGTNGILGQDLNTPTVDAAYAVRGGMDNRDALRTLTLDAAKILGVDDRVGSIAAGKDADLLILDGDPLHYRTFVQTALVNGKVVYEKDQEPLYSHIR
jgi:hypothetical protein